MPKGNILIIDDEDKLRQLIAQILELEGFFIYQAPNSKKSFQLLEQHQDILLVITDVKLPDTLTVDLLPNEILFAQKEIEKETQTNGVFATLNFGKKGFFVFMGSGRLCCKDILLVYS